jgi:hypothetical protein
MLTGHYLPTIPICTTDSQDIILNARRNTQMIQHHLNRVNCARQSGQIRVQVEARQTGHLSECDSDLETAFPAVAGELAE